MGLAQAGMMASRAVTGAIALVAMACAVAMVVSAIGASNSSGAHAELLAKAAGMSEESYLKAIGEYPCTEYAERPVFDEMDADYMRAAHYATRRQREREAAEEAQEAAAIKAGYTVEEWEAIRGGAFVL